MLTTRPTIAAAAAAASVEWESRTTVKYGEDKDVVVVWTHGNVNLGMYL